MGVGPSTPSIRCMNTAEAVQGLPRLVVASNTEQTTFLYQDPNSPKSGMTSKTKLPDVNIEKAEPYTSPGGMRTTKFLSNGSPAKRPTAFVNLPRVTPLAVKYDGLSANKTMEARRMEIQEQEADISKKHISRNSPQSPVKGQSNKLSPTAKSQSILPEQKDSLISLSVRTNDQTDTNERNICSGSLVEGSENQANKVQQNDSHEASKKLHETDEPTDKESSHLKKVSKPKKTAEEIAEKFEAGLKKLKTKCDMLSTIKPRDLKQEGEPFTHDFRQCVLVFANSYFYFKVGEVPFTGILRYRSRVAEYLCQSYVMDTILNTLADGLKKQDFFDESGKVLEDFWFPIKNMLMILMNYSDFVDSVKFSVAEHKEILPQMIKVLETFQEPHMNKVLSDEQERMLRFILGIVHNCGSLEENVPRIRDLDVIPLLLAYTDSPLASIRLSSIATLADLVNESEAELLSTHPRIFTFILQKLERALKMESHRDVGWSVEELLRAVRQLARNDANKTILVDKGCLPVLLSSIQVGNNEELQEALDCLWILSFDDNNKPKIVEEPGLIQAVCDKYHNTNGRAGHSCHGILWSLREVLQKTEEFQAVAGKIMNLKSQATPKVESKAVVENIDDMSSGFQFQGHVMISYQWANQEVIKRICSELRTHGIPVWIDIDYMGGSTLQAMAQAVEDSFAVIIAMSQKYKDSPNTRAEAEYTFQQRKPIIPLIMQNEYQPDGWLGLILGSKLYYDFSGKHSFESRMEGLLKAILTVAKRATGDATDGVEQPLVATKAGVVNLTSPSVLMPPVPIGHAPTVARQSAVTINEQRIRSWNKEDVSTWLSKYKLDGSALNDLSGEEVVFMHNLKHEAPEFFYRCLDKKLKVTSIQDLANASKAFQHLSSQA
ncbi:hypothetical protein RRG08_002468 [Elysia crispata]|uniref:TIR domain-containing protein n=1 Tax=Elysia crispata TaxID=231223 RepID=A0AAE1DU75_9GAST|nr:hypothetical protein RRG08_002468 [Elysia crispata]